MVNINILLERNRQAVMSLPDIVYEETDNYRRVIILEECSCLPDLPDGRPNGGRGGCCPACEAIPYGGDDWWLLKEMRENTEGGE